MTPAKAAVLSSSPGNVSSQSSQSHVSGRGRAPHAQSVAPLDVEAAKRVASSSLPHPPLLTLLSSFIQFLQSVPLMETPSKFSMLRRCLARCRRALRPPKSIRQKLETRSVTLDEPVLEAVLRNLSLRQRLQYRTVSRSVQTALSRLPLKVSFLMVRSVDGVCFDIVCDQPDFLVHYLLAGLSPTVVADGVRCKVDEVLFYLDTILSRLNGAEHLWLETSGHNGVLARRIFEFLHRDEGCARKRKRAFSVSQFTVVGTCSSPDFDAITELISTWRSSLSHLRLRHIRLWSTAQSESLWETVASCRQLRCVQYEPCRKDQHSLEPLVAALSSLSLNSLILTGVDGFTADHLGQITRGRRMDELSVVAADICPSSYSQPEIAATLPHLRNLLIQLESSFCMEDANERANIQFLLLLLSPEAVLEVVHIVDQSVSQTMQALNFWLQLASETERSIKVKFDDISQDRLDLATGRVLRKNSEAFKVSSSACSLSLSLGVGRVDVLDRKTWFGDEDDL